MKNASIFKFLGGEANLIAATFQSWKDKTFIAHLYKGHALDVNSLVRGGHSVYLLPANRVKIVMGSYQDWKKAKQDIKNWFRG